MTQSNCVESFLSIIRLGIGHSSVVLPNHVDWPSVKTIADEQGLLGVMIDGIECKPESLHLPKETLLEWIGEVLQNYEYRYELYRRAIADMAGFYKEHSFKMMVLKGYACGLNWPKPEHRPCGDIDIWLFGQQKEADTALEQEKCIKIDNSQHHHTVFCWHDFMVENHYDFINVIHHQSHIELEAIFKELGNDDTHFVELYGEKIYVPSPNLHALFLIKHLSLHFASEVITIRQLLDWAFFVEKHTKEVDWAWLLGVLDQYRMVDVFNLFNAICVEDLGFASNIFPTVQFNPMLKERILKDIFNPEFSGQKPTGKINRAIFRFRRWRANGWKHRLCYNESMWSAFWSGVRNHLLKPASI